MDTAWSKARKEVDARRERGDVCDAIIDMKLAEYEKSGWPISQYAFNNLFGEFLEAGATVSQVFSYDSRRLFSYGQHALGHHPCGQQLS